MCIRDSPEKVESILKFPEPRNIKQLQSFLGLCNFYRKFQKNYAHITSKLSEVLQKNKPVSYTHLHKVDWVNYQCFETAFREKYWSEEEQEILQSTIMGPGNFGTQGGNVTMYVMQIYNEAKYLSISILQGKLLFSSVSISNTCTNLS